MRNTNNCFCKVCQWNTWRRENHDFRLTPDLKNIDLYNRNLIGVNFANTNLTGTNLAFANPGAANLFQANLTDVNLQRGNLVDANLTRANLTEVIFVETQVGETDFMNVVMAHTVLANLDLRKSKNLDTINHEETSTLGIDTIMRLKGALPREFLRGFGLTEHFITFLTSLDYSSIKRRTRGEKYYTYETSSDGETIYTLLDTSKPVDQMVRQTREAPQGDGKTTEPYYLDPSAFIEKMSDVYKNSLY